MKMNRNDTIKDIIEKLEMLEREELDEWSFVAEDGTTVSVRWGWEFKLDDIDEVEFREEFVVSINGKEVYAPTFLEALKEIENVVRGKYGKDSRKILEGTCALCGKDVFDTDLFAVEENGIIFHLNC